MPKYWRVIQNNYDTFTSWSTMQLIKKTNWYDVISKIYGKVKKIKVQVSTNSMLSFVSDRLTQ